MKWLLLLTSLSLAACATPVEVTRFQPIVCPDPEPVDTFVPRDVAIDLLTGRPTPDGMKNLLLNLLDWKRGTEQLKIRELYYRNCIVRHNEQ